MRNRSKAGTLSLAILAACAPTGPSSPVPPGAVPMAAPAVYAEWFQRTEECAGLEGRLQRIEWYVVPGVEAFETEAGPKVGMWTRQGGREWIVVAGNYEGHEMVVRHEMLHSLLGVHGHPDDYFGQRCQLTWETWAEG
jgi:hypothetical protein